MIRTVCHRTLRLGAMRGAAAVAVRFSERLDQDALKAAIEALVEGQGRGLRRNLVGGGRRAPFRCPRRSACAAATARSRRASMSRRCGCRGGKIAGALSRQFPAATVGVYRLLCEIGRL